MHIHSQVIYPPPSKKSEGQIEGNTAISGIYSPNNNTQISKSLLGYQNILRVELNAILIAIKNIQTTKTDIHIFSHNLNNIYLINNHIQHPTSQHHHPNKLLIAAKIHQIYWTVHFIYIHKVRAHTGIKGNAIADMLANKGTLKEKPTATPHIHLAHATPYWLASCPTATHDGAIRNLHAFVTKAHDNREVRATQNKFP